MLLYVDLIVVGSRNVFLYYQQPKVAKYIADIYSYLVEINTLNTI